MQWRKTLIFVFNDRTMIKTSATQSRPPLHMRTRSRAQLIEQNYTKSCFHRYAPSSNLTTRARASAPATTTTCAPAPTHSCWHSRRGRRGTGCSRRAPALASRRVNTETGAPARAAPAGAGSGGGSRERGRGARRRRRWLGLGRPRLRAAGCGPAAVHTACAALGASRPPSAAFGPLSIGARRSSARGRLAGCPLFSSPRDWPLRRIRGDPVDLLRGKLKIDRAFLIWCCSFGNFQKIGPSLAWLPVLPSDPSPKYR